jgi:hypothetical protein
VFFGNARSDSNHDLPITIPTSHAPAWFVEPASPIGQRSALPAQPVHRAVVEQLAAKRDVFAFSGGYAGVGRGGVSVFKKRW